MLKRFCCKISLVGWVYNFKALELDLSGTNQSEACILRSQSRQLNLIRDIISQNIANDTNRPLKLLLKLSVENHKNRFRWCPQNLLAERARISGLLSSQCSNNYTLSIKKDVSNTEYDPHVDGVAAGQHIPQLTGLQT